MELPESPLYKDDQNQLIIPTVTMFELLEKFDGASRDSRTPLSDHPSRTVGHTVRPHCQLHHPWGVLI